MTEADNALEKITEARLWRDNGWTAQVIKNDADDGWAVVMTPDGQSEPALHQSIAIAHGDARVTVSLDIEPDDEHPSATLSALDEAGDLLARVRVSPSFKLTRGTASAWAAAEFIADALS